MGAETARELKDLRASFEVSPEIESGRLRAKGDREAQRRGKRDEKGAQNLLQRDASKKRHWP